MDAQLAEKANQADLNDTNDLLVEQSSQLTAETLNKQTGDANLQAHKTLLF